MSWSTTNSSSAVLHTNANIVDDGQQRADDFAYHQRPLLDTRTSSGYFASSRYGAVDDNGAGPAGRSSRRSSPEVHRDSYLNRVPEEDTGVDEEGIDDPEEVEWNLQEQGLYPGV
jgi:hypothetical protein